MQRIGNKWETDRFIYRSRNFYLRFFFVWDEAVCWCINKCIWTVRSEKVCDWNDDFHVLAISITSLCEMCILCYLKQIVPKSTDIVEILKWGVLWKHSKIKE